VERRTSSRMLIGADATTIGVVRRNLLVQVCRPVGHKLGRTRSTSHSPIVRRLVNRNELLQNCNTNVAQAAEDLIRGIIL